MLTRPFDLHVFQTACELVSVDVGECNCGGVILTLLAMQCMVMKPHAHVHCHSAVAWVIDTPRLTKCAMAAGRSSDGGDVTLSYALRAVLDSAVQEVRRQAGAAAAAGGGGREGAGASRAGSVGSFGDAAAAAATAVAPEGLGSGGEEDEKVDGGGVARVPAWELMQVEPRVVMGTTEAGSWGGGTTAGGGTVSGQSLPGGASMALVWNWEWEWGIVPRVPGVTFPECLPPPVSGPEVVVA